MKTQWIIKFNFPSGTTWYFAPTNGVFNLAFPQYISDAKKFKTAEAAEKYVQALFKVNAANGICKLSYEVVPYEV